MQRARMRELLAAPGLVLMPGAYDGLSARIIEAQGFQACAAGGYAALGSMLAEADMGQSNVRDYANHYSRICDAVSIPVFIDGDTGFGGVHNVAKMVRLFENAGGAAIHLGDQVFPNRCGYLPGKQVVPIEEMLARINAALDARRDPNLIINARTDAYGVDGLDAAIERCQIFLEAGADFAKPQGVDKIDEIARVMREVPCPHIATMSQAAGKAKTSLDELEAAGVTAVSFPSVALFAAAQAIRKVLGSLQSTRSLEGSADDLFPLEEYYDLVGLPALLKREESYDIAAAELLAKRAARG